MIIKSLSRKTNTAQLLTYLFVKEEKLSVQNEKPLVIKHNLRTSSLNGWINEFEKNESYLLHKRVDNVKVSILEFMEQNEGNNVRNLKYRIGPIFENNIFASSSNSISIAETLRRNSVINLSTLHTPELMKSVARFVLQAIYNRMLAEGPSKKNYMSD